MAVTAAQMKEIERQANESGLSYYQMMENAGTSAFRKIREKFPDAKGFMIFIGKGNNGGDGCVVARLAAQEGFKVTLICVVGVPVTPDAVKNFELLKDLPVEIISIDEFTGLMFGSGRVIVDAIYGTGFKGELRPDGRFACDVINASGLKIAALDVPSGVNCDTSQAAEGAVKADITISFHANKPVHEDPSAAQYCGEVFTADIGIRI